MTKVRQNLIWKKTGHSSPQSKASRHKENFKPKWFWSIYPHHKQHLLECHAQCRPEKICIHQCCRLSFSKNGLFQVLNQVSHFHTLLSHGLWESCKYLKSVVKLSAQWLKSIRILNFWTIILCQRRGPVTIKTLIGKLLRALAGDVNDSLSPPVELYRNVTVNFSHAQEAP